MPNRKNCANRLISGIFSRTRDVIVPQGDFTEKAYTDEEMAFFSTLTDRMDEAELELWLDRGVADGPPYRPYGVAPGGDTLNEYRVDTHA